MDSKTIQDRWLCRAKPTDHGHPVWMKSPPEWVVGYLLVGRDGASIWDVENNARFDVDESTICQCTGWTDNEKTLLFEHDLVDYFYMDCGYMRSGTAEVVHRNCSFELKIITRNGNNVYGESLSIEGCRSVRLIGNSFDDRLK